MLDSATVVCLCRLPKQAAKALTCTVDHGQVGSSYPTRMVIDLIRKEAQLSSPQLNYYGNRADQRELDISYYANYNFSYGTPRVSLADGSCSAA